VTKSEGFIMPCNHKFIDYLNLGRIDFEPTTLVVGTFNPSWDVLNNPATWFYGRTKNNYFWDVLPRLYENSNLRNDTHLAWKQFCVRNLLAITDLLQSIDDADSNDPSHVAALSDYSDLAIAKDFKKFTPVDIVNLLIENPKITNVYWTRKTGNDFWDKYWNTITDYCDQHGIRHRELLTPSGSARYQMQSGNGQTLRNFIFENWQAAWHPL